MSPKMRFYTSPYTFENRGIGSFKAPPVCPAKAILYTYNIQSPLFFYPPSKTTGEELWVCSSRWKCLMAKRKRKRERERESQFLTPPLSWQIFSLRVWIPGILELIYQQKALWGADFSPCQTVAILWSAILVISLKGRNLPWPFAICQVWLITKMPYVFGLKHFTEISDVQST